MPEKKLKNKPLFIPDKLPAGYANWQEWYSRNPNPEGRSLFPTEDKSKVKAGKLPKTEKFVDNLIKTYPQYKQYKKEDFLGMLDTIAQVESKNKNIKQQPSGPGRGYFQMETSSAETAQKRLMNIFKDLQSKGVTDIDTPAFNKDFTQLKNKDDQALHVIANMIGAAGAKRKATGKEVYVNPKDTKNSWLDYHWAGPEADRPARIKHYESTVKKMDFGGLADYDYNFNSQANSITYLAGKQREARENASRYKSGFIHTVGDTGKMIADNNLSALGLGNVIGSDDYATHLGANTFNDASNVIGEVSKVAAPLVLSAIAGPLAGAAYSAGTSALNEHVNPKEYGKGGEVNKSIKVADPNDPRLKAYDDSLALYKNYKKPPLGYIPISQSNSVAAKDFKQSYSRRKEDTKGFYYSPNGSSSGNEAIVYYGVPPKKPVQPYEYKSNESKQFSKRSDSKIALMSKRGLATINIQAEPIKTKGKKTSDLLYMDSQGEWSNKPQVPLKTDGTSYSDKELEKMGYRKSINKYKHGGEIHANPLMNIPESTRFNKNKINTNTPLNYMGEAFASGAVEESISPLDFIGGIKGISNIGKGAISYSKASKPIYIKVGNKMIDIGSHPKTLNKASKQIHKGVRQLVLPSSFKHGGEVHTTPADSTATKYSKPVINNTPANKHAEPSMFKQAIDFVLKHGTPLPENAARWASSTISGDKAYRIKDLPANVQAELYKSIKAGHKRAGKDYFGTEYIDYGKNMHKDLQKLKGNIPKAMLASLVSPDFKAATISGRVSVQYDKAKKLYHVYDNYDFSDVNNTGTGLDWGLARDVLGKVSRAAGLAQDKKQSGKLVGTFNEADWDKKIESGVGILGINYDDLSNGVNSMYKKAKEVFKFEDGGEVYNQKRADELGYMPDETGHLPSVDYTNGMWLKSKKHPTAFKELQAYLLSAELQKELKHPVVNPEGYFGENQLQYIPKKGDGGMTQTIINIEGQGKQEGDLATMRGKGEYRTDLLGNIKQNYAAFLPHPDGKGRHVASDVMAQEGDVIIPKKYSKQFKNSNKAERERMIMAILSQQQSGTNKMKRGGLIKKYDGTNGSLVGPPIFDNFTQSRMATPGEGQDVSPFAADSAGSKFDYNKALGLLSPLLKTGRGLFEKVENINPQDYMIRPTLKPELINDNATQMMINDATNAGMNSLSQTNAAPSARINLAINSMKQKWMAKQEAQKANAQSIMQTNAANAGIRGQDAAMGLSIRDKNDANIAARRNMFMEGTNDLSKFGHQQRYDKAFFEALPMMGNNPEFQKWLKANGYYKTTV